MKCIIPEIDSLSAQKENETNVTVKSLLEEKDFIGGKNANKLHSHFH